MKTLHVLPHDTDILCVLPTSEHSNHFKQKIPMLNTEQQCNSFDFLFSWDHTAESTHASMTLAATAQEIITQCRNKAARIYNVQYIADRGFFPQFPFIFLILVQYFVGEALSVSSIEFVISNVLQGWLRPQWQAKNLERPRNAIQSLLGCQEISSHDLKTHLFSVY